MKTKVASIILILIAIGLAFIVSLNIQSQSESDQNLNTPSVRSTQEQTPPAPQPPVTSSTPQATTPPPAATLPASTPSSQTTPTPQPPAPQPTPTQAPTPQPQALAFSVTADESVAVPSQINVPKGSIVKLTINVKSEGVYYGGIDFRSSVINSGTIHAGESKTITFTANASFTFLAFWPASEQQKNATIKVVVE